MIKITFLNPALIASKIEYSIIISPLGPTGVSCFIPPNRLPNPAAIITNTFFSIIKTLSFRINEIL